MSSATPTSRPGTVTVARAMLNWLAAAQMITVVLNVYLLSSVYSRDALIEIYRSAGYSGAMASGMTSSFFTTYYLSLALAVVLGIAYAVLARFVGKGSQGARVTSWVIVGLFGICCGAAGMAINAAGPGAISGLGGATARVAGGLDRQIVAGRFMLLVPDWATAILVVVGSVSLLASIIAVVALALPSSHPYFRQPRERAGQGTVQV